MSLENKTKQANKISAQTKEPACSFHLQEGNCLVLWSRKEKKDQTSWNAPFFTVHHHHSNIRYIKSYSHKHSARCCTNRTEKILSQTIGGLRKHFTYNSVLNMGRFLPINLPLLCLKSILYRYYYYLEGKRFN